MNCSYQLSCGHWVSDTDPQYQIGDTYECFKHCPQSTVVGYTKIDKVVAVTYA
jgi:hypothetical protein